MDITKVKTTIRYTLQLPDGAWKSVELGAEATVGVNENGEGTEEDWMPAQRSLYNDLKHQLAAIWPAAERPAHPPPAPAPPAATAPAAPPPQTLCPDHGKAKPSKSGGLYCPAKLPNGEYCKWTSEAAITKS